MARQKPIRLRETRAAPARAAKVIDAEFKEVGKRGAMGRIWFAITALFWAAVIGFLIPPAIALYQRIADAIQG
ncbi:MAG: hypothetical protein AB7O98_13875 [Hyphomonadaceae bacterium]